MNTDKNLNRLLTADARYRAALHKMQGYVARKMDLDASDTEPKHLRVGVNAVMSDHAALASLLIAKGTITKEEYLKAIADSMEAEQERCYTELDRLQLDNLHANGRKKDK